MADPISFALVGAGVIAPQHARAIAAHPQAKLTAIVDKDLDKARKMADEFHIPRVFGSMEEMLKEDDIQVVNITVPSGLHGSLSVAASQAGKHVLVEKPLEITSEKMTAMIDMSRKHGVKLGCIYQRRFMPTAVAVKEALRSNRLGKLVLGDVYQKYYRSPEYYKSAGWRGTWAVDGGGALMNQGVHGIDLMLWLAGDVESVFAYSAPLLRDIEVEDTAVAVVKYKNGAFGVIQGTTSVYPNQGARYELHGENGTIVFDDEGFRQWKLLDRPDEVAPEVERRVSSKIDPSQMDKDGHYILVDDMIRAIAEDRDPVVSGEEARKAVDVILAIYESGRTGREVIVGQAQASEAAPGISGGGR
ncbi:Gfo/Idh/MocA family protein [Paenibacillus koleovorans]|uniref:Gfo/Idh/MocA family protein n=1 Tax=Paenibacillus koleovorans TaxID=121608 RepID=UPI000FD9BF25|nr:Gfo/Idh/MocA family oxidoreductase [Paenibacillus koleovorans]